MIKERTVMLFLHFGETERERLSNTYPAAPCFGLPAPLECPCDATLSILVAFTRYTVKDDPVPDVGQDDLTALTMPVLHSQVDMTPSHSLATLFVLVLHPFSTTCHTQTRDTHVPKRKQNPNCSAPADDITRTLTSAQKI